jgi:hypothetical protein
MLLEQQLFRSSVELDDSNNAFARRISDQSRAVDRRVSLIQGRLLHFRGQYESEDESRGARAYYLGCRTSTARLEDMKKELGQASDRLTDEQLAAGRQLLEETVTRAKQNASLWLALMAADRADDPGEFQVAVDWHKRNREAFPDGPWTAATTYNLGRSLEAIGLLKSSAPELEEAQTVYRSDSSSPQAYQCQIRAQEIENTLVRMRADAN